METRDLEETANQLYHAVAWKWGVEDPSMHDQYLQGLGRKFKVRYVTRNVLIGKVVKGDHARAYHLYIIESD